MSVVVDSSVLVAALLDSGPEGGWSERIVAGGALYAPELVHVEATSALRRLESSKKITAPEANAAYEDLLLLEIELFPFAPFANRIWELRATVTSYDAWYVAVAEAIRFPLATLDGRLARAPGPNCKFLTPDLHNVVHDPGPLQHVRDQEACHTEGHARHPVAPGEFDDWLNERD